MIQRRREEREEQQRNWMTNRSGFGRNNKSARSHRFPDFPGDSRLVLISRNDTARARTESRKHRESAASVRPGRFLSALFASRNVTFACAVRFTRVELYFPLGGIPSPRENRRFTAGRYRKQRCSPWNSKETRSVQQYEASSVRLGIHRAFPLPPASREKSRRFDERDVIRAIGSGARGLALVR
jgi:hypothetical protein